MPALLAAPPPVSEPPPQTANAATIARGAQLFRGSCGMCHANTPNGMTPDLRRMSAPTHAAFKAIVLQGALRPLGMPQWDDVLSEDDVEAIHAWLIDESWKVWRAQQEGGEAVSEVVPSSLAH